MNRSIIRSVGVFVVTLSLLSAAPAAFAQGRGRGQAKAKVHEQDRRTATPRGGQTLFGSREREIISRYYGQRSGLPPGLAKRNGDLPPGLEKQLRRNGTLPPGLQKKLRPLPAELEHQLGPLPRGYRRGILDRHLVMYRADNFTIADLFRDAVR